MGSVRVNGKLVVPDSTTTLHHYDRVLFGTNHLFVYCNPTPSEEEFDALPEAIEWEYAQSEIAKNTVGKDACMYIQGLYVKQNVCVNFLCIPVCTCVNVGGGEREREVDWDRVLV